METAHVAKAEMIGRRERLLGPNNPLFYDEPIHIVRGDGVWLYGADGQAFLDCYNNVPSVGHCHPRVVEALTAQAGILNIHTRYLHETILDYAESLLSRFDDQFGRVLFACTGSEANDVAMRMARRWTGGDGFICTNATYHGNTSAVSHLSAIFPPPEGSGPHIRMVAWPDSYRALDGLTGEALGRAYAAQVAQAIDSFTAAGVKFAGMVLCPLFANEGLPQIPPGYMNAAVDLVHEARGLYIADEVQAGFGRAGRMWGHDGQDALPDIVCLGKPMGAGHPISGVVARTDVFDRFRDEVEYFNTFAGNPVSAAVGLAVLEVIDDEGLVANAASTGRYLLDQLHGLMHPHPCIGDVRGSGLFFGIDVVDDPDAKTPSAETAARLVNTMRDKGVLMSKIGEFGNVLKIRPPLVFTEDHADHLVERLDEALTEVERSTAS